MRFPLTQEQLGWCIKGYNSFWFCPDFWEWIEKYCKHLPKITYKEYLDNYVNQKPKYK